MFKKVFVAALLASIIGMIILYLIVDLLGSQIILKNYFWPHYCLWRHSNFLSRDMSRIVKYFCAFFLTNTLWSYVFYLRQKAFEGSGIEKGIKFFFLLWLLTLPIHFWSWILIAYSKKVLLYYVFIYNLILFLSAGAVIGKVCSDS